LTPYSISAVKPRDVSFSTHYFPALHEPLQRSVLKTFQRSKYLLTTCTSTPLHSTFPTIPFTNSTPPQAPHGQQHRFSHNPPSIFPYIHTTTPSPTILQNTSYLLDLHSIPSTSTFTLFIHPSMCYILRLPPAHTPQPRHALPAPSAIPATKTDNHSLPTPPCTLQSTLYHKLRGGETEWKCY
jgi:hypothetical protein